MPNFLEAIQKRLVKDKVSVGFDSGTSTIKIVKCRFLKESIELSSFSIEPTQVDSTALIKKLAQSQGISKVNISVSGPGVLIRYITFPKMQKNELQQALKFEAQKHIPFAVSEVSLDAHILKDDLPDNKMLILLAAVKKDFLSQRLKVFEDAGVRVNLVDIDGLALMNSFMYNYAEELHGKQKAIALLHIGMAVSSVNILEESIPRLSRDVHVAGNHFTQKLADTLGVDFKTAEGIKVKPNPEYASKAVLAFEAVMANLTKEIRMSFDYYESQNASTVGKIYVSGAGSNIPGFKDSLAGLLGIEVDYWDPLRKIILADDIDAAKIKTVSSQLAVAVGLALRT
ncbi:MAG TPA: type IV pilus assembly protein PilM [Candidatus Omnitrophota bacterium]|nr:type IV pilus assembly protein PilM [Candidatus Omnitrophota bacterium]HPT07953.1 type IV pilus assembly protein PilM [Candidatus Omnitrophota bacterium]